MLSLLFFTLAGASLLGDRSLDLKERPVAKVVRLLKDMQDQLEKEKLADEELYEKLSCWCETSEEDKTKAVATAERRIDEYTAAIATSAAQTAQLTVSLEQLAKETAKNTKALEEATTLRETEHGEFIQTEKDLLQSIQSVGTAIQVLSKHHESFLQVGTSTTIHTSLQTVLKAKTLKASHKAQIKSLLQQMPPVKGGSYAPASGVIFGTLKTMKESFETNLEDSRADEKKGAKDFADLKAAKTAEISAAKKQSEADEQAKAKAIELNANSKEGLENTREALAADRKFLLELKEKCTKMEGEWEVRSKTRSQEIAAVSETIGILTEDDSKELFDRSTSFVQKDTRRQRLQSFLMKKGRETKSTSLLSLASSVQLDSFEKVKAAIDDMVKELKKTMSDDVSHRDNCIEELNTNEKESLAKQREIDNLGTDIADMTATIEKLVKDTADLTAQVKEMGTQMLIASEDREAENKEFQDVVADQRATQAVLKKAIARMEVFYKKKALLQQEPGAAVAPPPGDMGGFKEYKGNAGGNGALMLLNNILEEAADLEAKAIKDEADAQASYEEFILNSNDSVATLERTISSNTEMKASTDASKVTAEGDRTSALEDAEGLAKVNGDLHTDCDFLLKNFDARQAAMTQEIEALGEAKGYLSGAK